MDSKFAGPLYKKDPDRYPLISEGPNFLVGSEYTTPYRIRWQPPKQVGFGFVRKGGEVMLDRLRI